MSTIEGVRAVCRLAADITRGTDEEPAVAAIADRLDGPLRIAIAGRVKAGKSTLLNALVGMRIAPTDAGECTRVVTWYREGPGYEATAHLSDGRQQPVPIRAHDDGFAVDMDGLDPADVERLEVAWPSSRLRQMTLIDTPGLGSIDDPNSRRAREFLALDDAQHTDADAVIYLMRHVHRADAEFLAAFMDSEVTGASPVNSVAVLSRADEIGGARLDSLHSAARIAERWRSDPRLASLCSDIVPMAGLLAETAQTWREDEAAAVRRIAAEPYNHVARMLLTVDDFLEPGASDEPVEVRRRLVQRLGMFGLRRLHAEVSDGRVRTATEMAADLAAISGLGAVRGLIEQRFLPRTQALKSRAALAALREVARRLLAAGNPNGGMLEREIERAESAGLDVSALRVAHLVQRGFVAFTPSERAELDRLLAVGPTARLLGDVTDARAAARDGAERWRSRGTEPLADPATREVAETMARAYEAAHLALTRAAGSR